MVGLVVVSHSQALADAAVALAMEMAGDNPPLIATAAGVDGGAFGTDAVAIQTAIETVDDGEGVVVLMDLGSAVFSSELALELIDPDLQERVHLTAAPLVEGLVAAVVQAAAGESPEAIIREATAGLHGKQAHLGTIEPEEEPPQMPTETAETTRFTVGNPHGLHARPAARFVAEAKRFDAEVLVRNLTNGSAYATATSLSRVAALGALQGHELEVSATGPQANAALAALTSLAARQFDEVVVADVTSVPPDAGRRLGASPGIAVGPKWTIHTTDIVVPEPDTRVEAADELSSLAAATAETRDDIVRSRDRVLAQGDRDNAAIFDAHLMLLDDTEVVAEVEEAIANGTTAALAIQAALERVEAQWAELDDPYLNARAADVRAVRNQLLGHLLGTQSGIVSQPGILVAEDLTPNEVAQLDTGIVSGIVTATGSPTSHMAILARSLGIPAVVAAGNGVLEIDDGTEMIIDGSDGTVLAAPDRDVADDYRARAEALAAKQAEARTRAHEPAITIDGVTIEVAVNMGASTDVPAVIAGGADSIGLVRTEFLFLDRSEAPTAAEQEQEYRNIADGIGELPLTIRTLDVGGDKPLSYLPLPQETNPFLGVRGIRLTLEEPQLFREQLTAIARLAVDRPVAVLFPMVTAVAELEEALGLLGEVCAAVGADRDRIGVGMMVEVPAVAANAAAFASQVDFLSIGTNDLTQYALATERGNPTVAHLSDALDPGVLRLVRDVVEQSGDAKVAVCGEIASDLDAVPLLVGLGVDELSVTPPAVPAVKDEVRQWSAAAAAQLATAALTLDSAAAVREAVSRARSTII